MIVQAIWEFDVDDLDMDSKHVNVKELCKDLTKNELKSLLEKKQLSADDFSYRVREDLPTHYIHEIKDIRVVSHADSLSRVVFGDVFITLDNDKKFELSYSCNKIAKQHMITLYYKNTDNASRLKVYEDTIKEKIRKVFNLEDLDKWLEE